MIITRAPLRISFFGGGTDFPEFFLKESGAVLATSIDKYSYVTASHFHSRLFDYNVRVSYSKGEMAKDVRDLQHPVFRACLEYCGLTHDIELHTVADLPAFTGLGSSSSFTVALLAALHAYKGKYVPPLELAYQAIHIERNVLKEAVGIQDQTTAAIGGFNYLEFRALDDIRVTPLALSRERLAEFESHLVLVFTGIKRKAVEIETKKLQNYDAQRDVLKSMRRMVDQGFELLVDGGALERFGRLLHQAWIAKRSLQSAISNTEIDLMYDRALAAGAWGGKLLGAGGGGFLLFVAPPELHAAIVAALEDKHHIQVQLATPGAGVVFAQPSKAHP
jgi:D-glycero-alpha-D-manno-heptose-7-phosphate kinase